MSGKTLTGEVLQSLMSFPSAQPLGLGLSFPFLAFRAFAHRAFTALRPISLGSAIILSHKLGIGQHRDQSGGAPNSGQKNIRGTAGDVGNMSGGEKITGRFQHQGRALTSARPQGLAGPLSPGERRGADDRR